MPSNIHPNAIIEPGAKIGEHVTVEAFAVVKTNVTLKDHVVIKSHAYIDGYTTIEEGTVIWPFASIGTKPQDLKYRGEKTYVTIGKQCEIREYVTINASCQENSSVSIGDHCLIMAYCHIAHNCVLQDHVIMANNSMLAGHVFIEPCAIIGGFTPVHQFCRIGCHAMVGGLSRVSHDVPPYTIGGGIPYEFGGINIVGLKRRAFSLEVRNQLAKVFRITYRKGLSLDKALEQIQKEVPMIPEVMHWIQFCRSSKRGLLGMNGITQSK
ncbi:MAG: acyl-ACP--UDP-N-acetylglucosamine O-acyltransferase [Parachlamydiales bacterium]|nr:acyl-ACP--UDP-N-acetylglucosamine O-acyltransferase [Parachlamydiales bacterium]